MTQPRSTLVSLDATPYYHCLSRCVRRAWLCGQDALTGRRFDHRKRWLVERFKFLSEIFAIDIAAYAVMSNHYHLVVHIDAARAASWSPEDVVKRWTRLYRGPHLAQRYLQGTLSEAASQQLQPFITLWRNHLFSLSRFMSCLNYPIARRANQEDGCTGRFWQGRFDSQALLDDTALLSCMAYVDLNPVRAGMVNQLEDAEFTSIQARIRQVRGTPHAFATPPLMPLGERVKQRPCAVPMLPYALHDYLELVDWTGRVIRNDKTGFITLAQPRLLSTLRLSERQWRLLALEVQQKSRRRLHGLNKLAALEKRARKILAA